MTRAQDAIAEGVADVIVHIAAGTYNENVVIEAVADGHSLSLIGDSAPTTAIAGLGDASVITVDSGVVNIAGLSITGGYAPSGGGIHNTTGVLTISDAAVTGNTATASTTLTGGGGIYNGNGTVRISDSTVSSNAATGTGNTAASGGGGGIYNGTGTLTISDSAVSGNTTAASGSLKGGGGIYNATGTLEILQSEVSNNTSTGTGNAGGIFGLGGGTVTIADSTVSNNTASYYVGGINSRGLLSITRSTVSDNTTERNYGGGISNYGGTLILADSTMSGNSAMGANTGKGGAIYNRGPATVINSTLYGNSATFGGGISNVASGALTVTNSTLADNTATREGGGYRWEGGTITISKTILSASTCTANSVTLDGGYNVSDSCTFYVPSGTSISGSTTIGLAPLATNGSTGPQTMAIDSSSSAHHLVPGCTGTDARGMARPGFGGTANCDAGAYELLGVAPTVTTHPQSQTLAISSDATFSAAASGTPTPTVQWQANTGTAWADISGATSTTLTLTDVTHAMSGTVYRAVFTNGVATGATTADATLTVTAGALHHLVLAPATGTIVAGGTRAFTAEGFDSFGNSLGDVTAVTEFTGPAGITCEDAVCTTTTPGSYTVTGTNGTATGTATLTVTAGALHHLVL
ncbi:beta strand repeat-containing protein, partial [Specibacter sp. RAF43]|uniref:beta strand repeat-containing protein n=1 Tax=Specibacter sp. RAF43 TaxID=3233057 RepID=UPI003F94374E